MIADKSLDTEQRVIDLIAEVCVIDRSGITEQALLKEDLGIDSVDTVSLILALEDEFGGVITDKETERLKTVEDVIAYIDNRLGEAG